MSFYPNLRKNIYAKCFIMMGNEEVIDDVLTDCLQRAYWSVYSRDTGDARIVVELVRHYIEEMETSSSSF